MLTIAGPVAGRDDAMGGHDDCILFLLAKAFQTAHATAKKRLGQYGLTPEQQLVLAAAADAEGSPVGEIGKKLRLDSATLSGILDRLAEKGLVAKRPDDQDKRVSRVFVSQQARELIPKMIAERDNVSELVLAPLTHEERVLFKRMLREIS